MFWTIKVRGVAVREGTVAPTAPTRDRGQLAASRCRKGDWYAPKPFAPLAGGAINGATVHEIGRPAGRNGCLACGQSLCCGNYRRVLVGLSGCRGESIIERR